MPFVPRLMRVVEGGELVAITLGHPLLDDYLEFVAARGAVGDAEQRSDRQLDPRL
jgi:hypothetical protein